MQTASQICIACLKPMMPNGHSTCNVCVDWFDEKLQAEAIEAWAKARGYVGPHDMVRCEAHFEDAVHVWLKLWNLDNLFLLRPGISRNGELAAQHSHLKRIAVSMEKVLRMHSQKEAHRRFGNAKPDQFEPM